MHRREPFLNKKENMVLAVLVALFQSATLVLLVLKTVESFLLLFLMEDELCNKEDCIFASNMQGKLLTYALFNLLCISVQPVYLKKLSPQWPTNPV